MIGFSMTKEQEAMRKSAREFCRKEIIPVAAELDQIADPDEVIPRVLDIVDQIVSIQDKPLVIKVGSRQVTSSGPLVSHVEPRRKSCQRQALFSEISKIC